MCFITGPVKKQKAPEKAAVDKGVDVAGKSPSKSKGIISFFPFLFLNYCLKVFFIFCSRFCRLF